MLLEEKPLELKAQKLFQKRIAEREKVKEIYDYRSKLVHGKAFVKKGRINWESLCVSPKMMTFPVSIMGQAFHVVLNVLTTIINNKEIMAIIKKRKSEEKITKELHLANLVVTMKHLKPLIRR